MADNLTTQSSAPATPPASTIIATRVVTYSGDSAHVAPVGLVEFSGSDDAKVATDVALGTITGAVTETAPTTDTASSGLNGRLQRIAQRITSLIAALGSPFQAGGTIGNLPAAVDTNSGSKSASTLRVVLATDQPQLTAKLLVTPDSVALPANQSVNVSQVNGVTPLMGAGNTGTGSPRVTIATDQLALPASQSGTWTVQPGNTPNTTAWKVDGSAVTQPVSIATAPVLVAGSAIIGKVGIDQTTPGTTNGVQVNAALPAGANAIGKLAANAGVTIGAVEIAAAQTLATVTTVSTVTNVATIGTSVTPGTAAANLGKAEDAVHTTGDVGVLGLSVSNENNTAFAAASGDYTPRAVNRYGQTYVTAPPPSHVSSNGTPIAATTTTVIAAPSAGNHLRVVRFLFSNGGATACWIAIRDGASGTRHYNAYLVQGASISLNLAQSGPLDLTTATRLDIFMSAAGSIEYEIDYFTVAD